MCTLVYIYESSAHDVKFIISIVHAKPDFSNHAPAFYYFYFLGGLVGPQSSDTDPGQCFTL